MSAITDKRLRCTCSALFETEEDLERHLDDNVEQSLLRDQWLQRLQSEARRYQQHAKVADTIHPDAIESENSSHGHGTTNARKSQLPKLVCPSCSRQTPFATKQKLRRHYEQRKKGKPFMDTTCDELRQLPDTQLDEALKKTMPNPPSSKKRKCEKADNSESQPDHAILDPRNITLPVGPFPAYNPIMSNAALYVDADTGPKQNPFPAVPQKR